MSNAEDTISLPEDFSGRVRLFPLPNLVMFPNVIQPLHVFEPRYCEMLEDAMAGDRLIAMARLLPGWEQNYEGRPGISRITCVGRVVTCEPQPGGRYNIMLLGLRRALVERELAPARTFREAVVEIVDDHYPPEGATARVGLQRKLVDSFGRVLSGLEALSRQSEELAGDIKLGVLTDIIAHTLGIDLALKDELLSEPNVDQRAALLLTYLAKLPVLPAAPGDAPFPPIFSSN